MPDFSRWGANGGDPSLNAIARTDRYLDALGAEQPVYSTDPADAELANLMAGWRDEVRRPPATGVATQRDAAIALERALGARRRARMSMAVLGSVAAALLCLGGFGAIVYGAGPGDAMYGLRTALFGEQQQTRTDQVALASQQLAEVQQLIDEGQWNAAQDKLQTLTTTVATVNDVEQKQELVTQWQDLTVKVDAKDPNATLPPGVPPPVMPEPAVVAPGSTTSTTTSSETSSSTSSSSESSSETTTSSSSSSETTSSTTTSSPTSSSPAPEPPPPSGHTDDDHDADDDHDHRHDDDNDDPSGHDDDHHIAGRCPARRWAARGWRYAGRRWRRARRRGKPPRPPEAMAVRRSVAVPKSSRPRRQSRQR